MEGLVDREVARDRLIGKTPKLLEEYAPVPAAFIAATRKKCFVPFVKPVIVLTVSKEPVSATTVVNVAPLSVIY